MEMTDQVKPMEEILSEILTEASSSNKLIALKELAAHAKEILENEKQKPSKATYEIREICLQPVKLALESKNKKLSALGLNGLQKLLAENRFNSLLGDENETEENDIVDQILRAVKSTPTFPDEIQVDIIKLLLVLTCSNACKMDVKALVKIIEFCMAVHSISKGEVRKACQVTILQVVTDLAQNSHSVESLHCIDSPTSDKGYENISDLIEMLNVLCKKVSETHRGSTQNKSSENENHMLTLELESILTIFLHVSPKLATNQDFQKCVWQELCPTLIAILGIPKDDKMVVASRTVASVVQNGISENIPNIIEHGRGSSSLSKEPLRYQSARQVIFAIAAELVRCFGGVESMRPVLGSLYHRILLFPPPNQRLDALKLLKELLGVPERILDIAGPPHTVEKLSTFVVQSGKPNLDLLKLLVDGIQEASECKDTNVKNASVACIFSLLTSLEKICQGEGLLPSQTEVLLEIFKDDDEEEEEAMKETEIFITNSNPHHSEKPGTKAEMIDVTIETAHDHDSNQGLSPNGGEDPSIKRPDGDGETEGGREGREESSEERAEEEDEGGDGEGEGDGALWGNKDIERKGDKEIEEEGRVTEGSSDSKEKGDEGIDEGVGTDDEDAQGKEQDQRGVSELRKEQMSKILAASMNQSHAGREDEGGDEDAETVIMNKAMGNAKSAKSNQTKELKVNSKERNCINGLIVHEDSVFLEDHDDEDSESDPLLNKDQRGPMKQKISPDPLDFCHPLNVTAEIQAQAEKQGAQDFADSLVGSLPSVMEMGDIGDADFALRQFASKFVAGFTMKKPIPDNSTPDKLNLTPVINADGIYVASCYGLLLNLKLIKCGHYENPGNLPLTQKQFVDNVHSSGVLVYLSATWLGEFYRILITRNLLEEGGYDPCEEDGGASLITLLIDIDGLGSQNRGGQMLREAAPAFKDTSGAYVMKQHPPGQAGAKFSNYILTSFWSQMVAVLSVPLKGHEGSSKEGSSKDGEAVGLGLDGLRKAAELTCKLGLQTRCAAVFSHLAEASCAQDETTGLISEKRNRKTKLPSGVQLHAAHALSMDTMLSMGLEMGSHARDCWRHLFRCCAYISQLEHTEFSSTKPSSSTHSILPKVGGDPHSISDPVYDLDDLDLAYTPVTASGANMSHMHSVADIIKGEKEDKGGEIGSSSGALLTSECAKKVVCSLSSEVDRLFEEAASKLNLQALLGFLRELATASQDQLYNTIAGQRKPYTLVTPTSPSKSLSTSGKAETSLHLFRLGDVILRGIRHSGRPLLHLMQAWSVVAPHLVEAACHKDRHVSKRATEIIHDVLTEIFTCKTELDYFHFHEALLKPFESLLCLELCDNDVQDQVVTSICEVVEASFTNIKSGWRPLFGALRAVRYGSHLKQSFSEINDHGGAEHPLAPVCNVFEAFLNTDNAAVFANAAIDCILCLLKFVKSTAYEGAEDSPQGTPTNGPSSSDVLTFDMCLPALNYLHRCHKILASIYVMPAHPVFRGAQSIKLGGCEPLSPLKSPSSPYNKEPESFKCGPVTFDHVPSDEVDDKSGINRVWFLLLEGLTGAVSSCPANYQPQTLQLLFDVLNSLLEVPGQQFAIYAVTELLLPMMQSWVRRNRHNHSTWDSTTANFKQACGLTSDLVVNYLTHFLPRGEEVVGLPLMLRQLLDLMVECICQANESVARLGCSCIRHLLLSVGPLFTHDLWTVACRGMQRAVAASLRSVKQLMACFHPGSEDFMGDVCSVKVAARQDVTEEEYLRLQQLAQQVFLVESQRHDFLDLVVDSDAVRSFIFIIYPPEADLSLSIDLIKNRVSFRSLVLGLLSHQLLIQTLGTLLLHGSENSLSNEQGIISTGFPTTLKRQDSSDNSKQGALPGLLPYLSPKNLSLLLECFVQSYQTAYEFNSRPGLKFLLQKVARFEVAVNLYWQAGMSFTFYVHTLLEVLHHVRSDCLQVQHIKALVGQLAVQSKTVTFDCPPLENSPDAEEQTGSGRPRSETNESRTSKGSGRSQSESENLHLSCELTYDPSNPQNTLEEDMDWIIKRLYGISNDVCSSYIQMFLHLSAEEESRDRTSELPLFFLVAPPVSDLPSLKNKSRTVSDTSADEEKKQQSESASGQKEWKFASQWSPKVKCLELSDDEQFVDVLNTPKDKRRKVHHISTEDGRVYTVATKKTIKSLMQEYKKRKTQHSRSVFVKKPTYKEQKYIKRLEEQQAQLTPEERKRRKLIEEEQRSSIMRDNEAMVTTWSEMILTLLQLLQLLPDSQFKNLLPVVFPCVSQLICHVTNGKVRKGVLDFMERIARLFDIL